MVNAIEAFDAKHLKPAEEIPAFRPGDTVEVNVSQYRNQMRRMAGKKQLLQAKPWGILQSASLGNKSQLRDNGLLHQQFYQSSQPYLQLHILCIAFEALHDLRHRQ